MTTQEIIEVGAAPNKQENSTIAEAWLMVKQLSGFAETVGIIVNTRRAGPANASYVPLVEIDPEPGADVLLNYAIQVQAAGRIIEFGVSVWHGTVLRWGQQDATSWVLDVVNPAWKDDHALAAKVAVLPGPLPAPIVVVDPAHLPPTPAMPDWDNPIGVGRLAVRPGDASPFNATSYTSPSGVKWDKKSTIGFGGLESDARWEREA